MPQPFRRHLSLVVAALALAAAPLVAADAEPATPRPRLVAPQTIADLKIVPVGTALRHVFEIRNEGTAPLEITSVHPDCGCTVPEYDRTIAPGETGRITLTVDTANMEGPETKRIRVLTNDPATPELQLTLKFTVRPIIAVRPGYARYIYVQGEVPGVVAQTLWAEDEHDLQILDVKSPYPFLQVSFREAKPEERRPEGKGRQWRLETVLQPTATVGALADFVVITTNHPKQTTVKVPVSGFVRPVLAVTPDRGDFGDVELEQPVRATFYLQGFPTEGLGITKVEATVPGVRTELKTISERQKYQVMVTLPSDLPKGPFQGVVRIHTDSAKSPTVDVPIQGTVK